MPLSKFGILTIMISQNYLWKNSISFQLKNHSRTFGSHEQLMEGGRENVQWEWNSVCCNGGGHLFLDFIVYTPHSMKWFHLNHPLLYTERTNANSPLPSSNLFWSNPFVRSDISFTSLPFSLIETPIVARGMSFTSFDSFWSKPPMLPETCPLPLSNLCDRSDLCGQTHVLYLSRFSVIEAIIVGRDMSLTSLDSLWSCDHCCQRHVFYLFRFSLI